jgi:uncharacterized protein
MLIFLDTNVVIYLIEQPAVWGPRAATWVGDARAKGERFAVSDLVRMECRVKPRALGDTVTVAQFDRFFASSDVLVVGVTAAVCDRATDIRASRNFKPLDALRLAAAVEAGCDRFLTHDTRLSRFPDIPVEILP